ncbi:MAG: glycosyltransferase family 2 protein [Leptolyngbyaceae cyanobacterium SL_7_1]|nr:glycosyltransferase family 2 protein [Leptolyngbyaceae cyanobacterium SL_7_1]
MKFSLVLATLGRVGEVEQFLASLALQTYQAFELIVVDQNPDDRLLPLIESYRAQFPILHLRSEKGLSRARNVGLKHLSGDIVAFPDDDCAYLPTVLEQVAAFFSTHSQWNGLTGRSINQAGENSGGRWVSHPEPVNRFNVWQRGISYTIFLRRSVVTSVGLFDEQLGVGAGTPWGAAEETDYLLRALDAGIYYNPEIRIIHPVLVTPATPEPSPDAPVQPPKKQFLKTYAYALGMGYVLRKHNTVWWFVLYNWGRPSLGLLLSLVRGQFDQVRSYWATLRGRVRGWMQWA